MNKALAEACLALIEESAPLAIRIHYRGVPLADYAKQEAQLTRAEADRRNAATRCNGLLPCRRRQRRRRAVVGRPGRLGSGRLADDPQTGDNWRVG
jgi:hypothetical protein